MERIQTVQTALLALLVVLVALFGGLVVSSERHQSDSLDRLICFEKLHALAAVAVMVPDDRVDADGRVESARSLGSSLDNC